MPKVYVCVYVCVFVRLCNCMFANEHRYMCVRACVCACWGMLDV